MKSTNKPRLFEFLAACDPSALLSLLSAAYDAMDHDQRQTVFARLATAQPPAPVEGEALLDEVEIVFAEGIGMSPRHLGAIKSAEARNHYFHELGATKLAALWVLEHFGKPGLT